MFPTHRIPRDDLRRRWRALRDGRKSVRQPGTSAARSA